MILQFRTKQNANGNCKYLGIDTGAECYATEYKTWISKGFAELKMKDYREQCERHGFKRVEYI